MNTTIFSALFLPITLAVITFGLGLSISVQDLRNIIVLPRNIAVGLFSQLVLLPIIAFGIAIVTGLKTELAVGLILISICPGGATSNLVNFMVRANVALSISITVINGLITIVTIPLIAQLALDIFMEQHAMIRLSFLESVLNIFMVTVLPASVGILVRYYREEFAKRLEDPLRYILPILLIIVFSAVLFLEKGNGQISIGDFLKILPYTFALNILAMLAGLYFPRLFGINKLNQVTIAVEVGLQNSTLAIFVAASLLGNYTIAMVAVVYGSFSFFTTWGFGYMARKYL
ncbi:bile acid:sodium symporter family protein [Bacteroidota bacterium]